MCIPAVSRWNILTCGKVVSCEKISSKIFDEMSLELNATLLRADLNGAEIKWTLSKP